jgi:hypothetical protein
MLSIRLVAAGAAMIIAMGGAAAQSAATDSPGKPIQLLQILQRPGKARTKLHAKPVNKSATRSVAKAKVRSAAKSRVRSSAKSVAKLNTKLHAKPLRTAKHSKAHGRLAAVKHASAPARAAKASPPANIWPAVNTTAAMPLPETTAPANVAAAALAPQDTSALAVPAPNELVVRGQTVQVSPPDELNQIDRAAGDREDATVTAQHEEVATAKPVAHAMVMKPAQPDPSQVGSASWIAQVLAALGGAVAAGSVAWFLIGSTPYRTYG